MRNPKTLFLLADGARARLVERSSASGDFVTIDEIDGRGRLQVLRAELRASPPARSFAKGTPHRHSVGREDFFRQAKEAFVEEVAGRAAEVCRTRGFADIFVAAPPRLIGPLKESVAAKAKVSGALERDLTKSPDATLPKWLDHVLPGAGA